MALRNPKDLAAGLLFMAFGIAVLVVASDYPFGTTARMGPGYFPRILGGLLGALGAVIALRSFVLPGSPLEFGSPLPVAIVLGGVVLFGITVPFLGLILSAFLLVVISSFASTAFRFRESLISGAALAAASAAVFVYGLGLNFAPWPPLFAGQ